MITLVLGGTRSGKSEVAETIALRCAGEVLYFATGVASDPSMTERIEQHRGRRDGRFRTIECGSALTESLLEQPAEVPALIDALGTWVAGHSDFAVATDALLDALGRRRAATVIVSDEVGLGVHPPTDVGVRFRDALGTVNRAVADVADDVLLVIAGRVLPLDRLVDSGTSETSERPDGR